MLSTNIHTLLKPYKLLLSKVALSPTYRCLQIKGDRIIGCSRSTVLETFADLGLTETVYVEAAQFLTIMESLPSEKEVTFNVLDGVLHWKCATAKGKIAQMVVTEMPSISRRTKVGGWTPSADFVRALRLGALSASDAAVLSMNMHGVVLDSTGDTLIVHSSDNVTISLADGGDFDKVKAPPIVTLHPETVRLLSDIIQAAEGTMEFDGDTVLYSDKYCCCLISQKPALAVDTMPMVRKYTAGTNFAKIDAAVIKAFIKRVSVMTENRRSTYIVLGVSKGQLSLEFHEGVSTTDEFHLIEGLDVPDIAPLKLDANRLARALEHITEVMLDHFGVGVVVFVGHKPEYTYIIQGIITAPVVAAPAPDPLPIATPVKKSRKKVAA